MKNKANPLLDDVSLDALTPGFRDALLTKALAELDRGRRIRRLQRNAAASLLGVACVSWSLWRSHAPKPVPESLAAYRSVQSVSFAPNRIVLTRAGSVPLASTRHDSILEISTRVEAQAYRNLNDQELLSFFAGKPVVLISAQPHRAELYFLNPADSEGFELQ